GMDTVLNVWTLCLFSLAQELACDDDDATNICGAQPGADRDSAVAVPLSAGEQAVIRVAYDAPRYGDGGFLVNASFDIANDDCAGAIPVSAGESVMSSFAIA